MSKFDRRLPEKSYGALKQLSSKRAGWWPDLLSYWAPSGSSGELRLAIRNNYMNFYSKGQSIAKISFGRGGASPTMRIHEKYVYRKSDGGQRYVRLTEREGRDANGRLVSWGGREMLREWILNSRCYTSAEKCHIESLVRRSPKVIDLEMGLPAFGNRKSPLRIDLVSLEGTPDDIRIVFWEGKMISDQRLRSKSHQPKVFEQMNDYRCYLTDVARKKQVTEAYRRCCGIMCNLHTMASDIAIKHPLDPLVEAAARPDSCLSVETTPRLVIFEDYEKRDEAAWQRHLKVLQAKEIVTMVDESSANLALEAIPRFGG